MMEILIWALCFNSLLATAFGGLSQSIPQSLDRPPTYEECEGPPPKYNELICYEGKNELEIRDCNEQCYDLVTKNVPRAIVNQLKAGVCRNMVCICKWLVQTDGFTSKECKKLEKIKKIVKERNEALERRLSVDSQRSTDSSGGSGGSWGGSFRRSIRRTMLDGNSPSCRRQLHTRHQASE